MRKPLPMENYYFELDLGFRNCGPYSLFLYDKVAISPGREVLRFRTEVSFGYPVEDSGAVTLEESKKVQSNLEKAILAALRKIGKRKELQFTATRIIQLDHLGGIFDVDEHRKSLTLWSSLYGDYKPRKKNS